MKKTAVLLAGAALMMTLNSVHANAYTIDYSHALNGSELTSSYSGTLNNFQLLNFNDVILGNVNESGTKNGLHGNWTGDATVVNGSSSGLYAAPYGHDAADGSNFLSVPNPTANGKVHVQLGNIYNYFGLWWGSVDSYNTLSFFNGDTQVASFTGSEAITESAANGNQTAPSTNLYVNFLDLPSFDAFEMKSTSYAFEADNIAFGNSAAPVPEPGTIVLLGAGMLGMAFYGKRRMSKI